MRILHVVQSLDPSWGGIARVLPVLAAELAAAGEECRIATLRGDRFGAPPDVPDVEVLPFEPRARSSLGTSGKFNAQIKSLVADADVVHLHGLWTGQNWAAGKTARKLGRPYIMTPHSMMMPWAWHRSRWKKRPVGWLFEHANLRHAACLHALAQGEADHMLAFGFNDSIEVIPNGLHVREYDSLPPADALIQRFPELRDPRWLLFLGRIHPQKGIVQTMKACFDVLASADEWHLVIAGPDEIGIRGMLESAVARKGMRDRVTFTGMLQHEEVLACIGRASILIQPSMSEGLSMSVLESLAGGLPVLISNACNMPEVEQANAGRIVPPDRISIAAALRHLVTLAPESLKEMGQNGRTLVRERFDWSGLIPKYRKMYAAVQAG
ncbi:MAG: glycosyltransferase [Planctomycetota bacterium]